MSNKFKLILIAVELFILVVLLLLGVGCQQRWIIVTGNGPRFDWYAVIELDEPTKKDVPALETEDTAELETTQPPPPETTIPLVTTPPTEPATEPEETTNPTEDTSHPTTGSGSREDELPLVPIG